MGTATPAPACCPHCGFCLLPSETLVSPCHGQGSAPSRPPPRAPQKSKHSISSEFLYLRCSHVYFVRCCAMAPGTHRQTGLSTRGSWAQLLPWDISCPATRTLNRRVPACAQKLTGWELKCIDQCRGDGKHGVALGEKPSCPGTAQVAVPTGSLSRQGPLPGLPGLQPPGAPGCPRPPGCRRG